MDSYAFELYPSTSQKSTLTQVVSDIEHFAHRHPSTVYSHPAPAAPRRGLLYYYTYGMPQATQRNPDGELETFSQYLQSARSISRGPCVPSRLLWTSSNHSDRSLNPVSSFSDAGPGASASKFDSSVQDDQNTNSGTHVYGLHNNAIITSQTPGPRRPVDSPKRRHTEIYRDEGTSAMLPQSERGNNTGKLQLKCGLCPNFFVASKGDLKRHLESLAHKKPSYICEGCDRKFTREDALKRHKLHTCPPSSKKATKTIGGK